MNNTATQWFQQAFQCHQSGDLNGAEVLYKRVLTKSPRNAETLYLLGSLCSQRGQHAAAIDYLEKAIALDPRQAKYHNNRGVSLREVGRLEEAQAAYECSLALQPDYAQALFNMGHLLDGQHRLEEAQSFFARVVALKPDWAEAQGLLGTVMHNRGLSEQGLVHLEKALALGACTKKSQITIIGNVGVCLQALGRYTEARACYDQVLSEDPNTAEGHLNLAMLLLLLGEMESGWAEYEWRLATNHTQHRAVIQPRWDGSPLAGRTLLVHAEQGFGDSFQFIRYLPLIQKDGGRIIFECQPSTRTALARCHGYDELIERTDMNKPDVTTPHDLQIPLASLPHLYPHPVDAPPGGSPYLSADPATAKAWGSRLAQVCAALPGDARDTLKVGLVWAGNPKHKNDHNRSMALRDLAPLAQVTGVTFFSLQCGPPEAETSDPPCGMTLVSLANLLSDFGETAGLLTHLDLIICVDTSLAHLAGAMGRPVWLLLPHVPDFRWLLERADSPWYPSSMHLFRQPKRRDWASVVAEVAEHLQRRSVAGPVLLQRILQAEAFFATGDSAAAKAILEDLAATAMPHPRVHNNLGVIHWQEGNAGQSLCAFLQALELSPSDQTTRQNCAAVMQALGHEAEAQALLGHDVSGSLDADQVMPGGTLSPKRPHSPR